MFKPQFSKKVLFIGIPDMAYIGLDGLHSKGVNIVGVLGPKKDHPTYEYFKQFVISRNLNFIEYDSLKEEQLINEIKSLQIDIAVVCSFNYKVPKILLESVKDGFVNVHPSLLPKYRGANPYTAAIMNNEEETGVTIHFMDETFDTGNIIHQKKTPIIQNETMGTLFNRLNILGLDMLLEVLNEYEKQPLKSIKQPEGEFILGPSINDENTNINFNKSAEDIERFIRSLNPFIGAKTQFRNTLVKITSADMVKTKDKINHEPGSIVKIEDNKFFVATGKDLLSITSLQFGSFFTGSAKEFIKILNPQIGEKFIGEKF